MEHEYMTLWMRDDEKIRNSFDIVMLTDSPFRYSRTS